MLLNEIARWDPDFSKIEVSALTPRHFDQFTDLYDGDEDLFAHFMERQGFKPLTQEDADRVKKAVEDIARVKVFGPGLDEEKNEILFYANRHRVNQHVNTWSYDSVTLEDKLKKFLPPGYTVSAW